MSADEEVEEEETVIGVHHSGIEFQEGMNVSISRNYCANCRRQVHCFVKIDRETKEVAIHDTCKNKECECKCRVCYVCKECGNLHPYGKPRCTRISVKKPNVTSDKIFDKIMDDWRN